MIIEIKKSSEENELTLQDKIADCHVAKAICDWLEIEDANRILATLDDGEKIEFIEQSDETDKSWTLSFSGYLFLLFHSPTVRGKDFRRWVIDEVLPSIILDEDFPSNVMKLEDDPSNGTKRLDEHYFAKLSMGMFVNGINKPDDIVPYVEETMSKIT